MANGEIRQQTDTQNMQWELSEKPVDPFAESARLAQQEAMFKPLSPHELGYSKTRVTNLLQNAQIEEIPPGTIEGYGALRRHMPAEDYKPGTPDVGVLNDQQLVLYVLRNTGTPDLIDAFVSTHADALLGKPDPNDKDSRTLQRQQINGAFNQTVGIDHLSYDKGTRKIISRAVGK